MTADPERTADTSDMDSMEDETEKKNQEKVPPYLVSPYLDRLAALQQMEALPKPVKRRIKALKQLQLAVTNIEAEFYKEIHALECAYYQKCASLYEKRTEVVNGTREPTDEECVWESDEEEEALVNEVKKNMSIKDVKDDIKEDSDVKGIPDFWLTIFKNVALLSEMVQEHDEPILKHLQDIKVIFLKENPMGFILEFHFEPNDYFANTTLTKEYIMKCVPDKDDPFSFEGPEIYKSKGCLINWKKGKNVTVKTIKKNQKHKSKGSMRTVTKTVQNDSFFNFFAPPVIPEDADTDVDDETQALLTSDFEIGHYIRERIVPKAVLYFTGEALEDEDEDYEEEEGPDDEDEETEDDDDVDNEKAKHGVAARPGENAADCKQQ